MATPAALPVSAQPHAVPASPRLDSIDLLRGLVMVVMMLDHTRDFTHWATWQFAPEDLARTTPALFLTRWITHFCAPVFFFLAGTGAFLKRQRGATTAELSRFLWTRGLWLILLELTVVRFGYTFTFDLRLLAAVQTIWALGWSMIMLAALVHLPVAVVGAVGAALVLMHNALDGLRAPAWSGPGSPVPSMLEKLWYLLHQPGGFPIAGEPSPMIMVIYPLVPWIGVMALGFVFGQVYRWDAARRRRRLVRVGIATIALFVLLRATNLYGDPTPWTEQPRLLMSVLAFLNTTKYPPSLSFLAMTLGPALLFLAWSEGRARGWLARVLVTFGRVPLVFYLGQWYVAHLIAFALFALAGKPTQVLFFDPFTTLSAEVLARSGFPLWVTWVAWLAGVALLYPACRWFAGVKARRRDWWLGYL